MKTQGEIEAAVCDGIVSLERTVIGRGPKDIQAHLVGDLLVVRLQGALSIAEQHLAKMPATKSGRDLLKQCRTQLIELARPAMEALVQAATGVKILSLHHDISTNTGEEIVLFTLTEAPLVREKNSRPNPIREYSQREKGLETARSFSTREEQLVCR